MKEMIDIINQSEYHPRMLFNASGEAIKAAKDRGMVVHGVNMSGYFTTETFMMSMDCISKSFGASPSNPIAMIGDGARIHVTPEVRL